MPKPKIYSRYDVPPSVGFDTGEDSIVDKNAAYDCDINNIIKRYQSVEELELEMASKAVPVYGRADIPYTVSEIFQMREGLQETYSSLPEDVRKEFGSYNNFIQTVSTMPDEQFKGFFTDAHKRQEELQRMRTPVATKYSTVETTEMRIEKEPQIASGQQISSKDE